MQAPGLRPTPSSAFKRAGPGVPAPCAEKAQAGRLHYKKLVNPHFPSDKTFVVELNQQLEESAVSSSDVYRERALKSLSTLPPFSPILNRLIASLASEDVSFTKLAELIEKDLSLIHI